jgi:2Fe-2S ferredoxin
MFRNFSRSFALSKKVQGSVATSSAARSAFAFLQWRQLSAEVDSTVSSYLKDQMGIESHLHRGILKALQSTYGNNIVVAELESFGESGLKALAESVSKQRSKTGMKQRPFKMIHFEIPHHRTEFDLKWKLGNSVMDVAKSFKGEEMLGEYLEGTCGGHMSCCSCHIYVDEPTFKALPNASEAELDMLDLAFEPREHQSRLGCQVQLDTELLHKLESDQPVVITIPADVNNVWS